jgi:hypothetical protein
MPSARAPHQSQADAIVQNCELETPELWAKSIFFYNKVPILEYFVKGARNGLRQLVCEVIYTLISLI